MDGSNWVSHVRKMTPEELARLDEQIAKVERLRDEKHDRRQSQQAYEGEEKRHGDRRHAPREQED